MKKIDNQKLQAFSIGAMGKRPLTKKEQEELRKKEEEEAAANAFKEFVETFQEAPSNVSKVWVKAGTYDAGSRREDNREKGKLYKPTSKIEEKSSAEKAQEYAKLLANDSSKKDLSSKKKSQEKKKSNLELFKEELRQIQEEREERHKYKSQARSMLPPQSSSDNDPIFTKESESGSFDNGDPNTTNLYLGNLNPKISEQQLMELFGKYGPLASIKIMWPRSEEEKSRGRNCGFVAYMSRKDADRALRSLNGKDVMGYEMKLGWGKSVPILTHPIYIPPALMEFAMPPKPSGLPFNAQIQSNLPPPKLKIDSYLSDSEVKKEVDEVLYKSVIKVVIPHERAILAVIHRMIEFVIREGPMFEAIIMNRELENPMFRFLFENESPAHIYYRWKLFSLLQGDTKNEWKENEFRMFEGGSIWKPPPLNFYTQGMPEELLQEEEMGEPNKGALSTAQRDRLEDLIRHLTPERSKIGDAMIFCIEHADAADEICECLAESVSNPETLVHKKIARLYLASDILHNCGVKISNASFFRKSMEKSLLDLFKGLHKSYNGLESRLKAEGFKIRVLKVCRAWEEWAVYPREFLTKLQNTFLGLPTVEETEHDIDGAPLSGEENEDEDVDGIPLDGAALLKGALLRGIPEAKSMPRSGSPVHMEDESREMTDPDDDIDGIPFDEDIDGIPLEKMPQSGAGFIPSKWETVDPDKVEAQAVTTSKWDTLDPVAPEPPNISQQIQDSDSSNDDTFDSARDTLDRFDEDKRTRLREIELKAIQYQDELESGQRSLKPGWTISQQTEHFRRRLTKKSNKESREVSEGANDRYASTSSLTSARKESSRRSSSPIEIPTKKSKKSKRSPSPQYSRSSPLRTGKLSRRSKSPHSKRSRDSTSPPSKRSKRPRSKSSSSSDSPKRYTRDRSSSITRSSRYDLSPVSNKKYRSPSPVRSSRYELSPQQSKKYRSPSPVRMSRYELSPQISKKYRSPSPALVSSRTSSRYLTASPTRLSTSSSSRRTRVEVQSPVRYEKRSPSRHRSDKHKHKHKY